MKHDTPNISIDLRIVTSKPTRKDLLQRITEKEDRRTLLFLLLNVQPHGKRVA